MRTHGNEWVTVMLILGVLPVQRICQQRALRRDDDVYRRTVSSERSTVMLSSKCCGGP